MNYLRKKLQGLRMCADFKCYLREVTGAPPLTLTDCMGSDLVSLSITGNAIQDGTPSPETPVEVQGCGDRTGNLFDISNRTELQSVSVSYPTMAKEFNNNIIVGLASAGYWDSTRIVSYSFDGDNFTLQSSAGYGLGFDFDVSEGETYTVSYTATITGSNYVAWYDAEGMYMSRTSINRGLASVTVPDGAAKLVLCFVTYNNSTMTISKVQVIEGDYTAEAIPVYEPYGYKVPVKVGGINLFDVSQLPAKTSGYVQDGAIYVTGYPYLTGFTPEEFLAMTGLKEGDTFTTAADYEQVFQPPNPTSPGAQRITFAKKSSAPADLSDVQFGTKGALKTTTIPEGFNSDNYFGMYIYGGSGTPEAGQVRAIYRNLRVYKGTYTADTMPAYEPYHEPQTVNVYTDKPLYGQDGEAWSEVVYDGTENWYTNGTSDDDTLVRYFLVSQTKTGVAGPRKCVCTHYPKTTHNVTDWWEQDTCQAYGFTSQKGWFSICVNFADYPTVGSWKAFLQAQYAAGTPLKAYFATEESAPAETTAPTHKSTTVISADTTIQPSSMTAKYYATKKED